MLLLWFGNSAARCCWLCWLFQQYASASEVGNAYFEYRRREVCNGKIKKDSLEFQSELSKMSLLYQMVGVVELESTTSTMSTWRSNQLSYTPAVQCGICITLLNYHKLEKMQILFWAFSIFFTKKMLFYAWNVIFHKKICSFYSNF